MDKVKLLEQMREDNKKGDERVRAVDDYSYAIAFKCVIVVCGLYYIIASLTSTEHDHTRFYMLYPMMTGTCAYYFVKYHNDRKLRYLLGLIFYLFAIIMGTIWLFADKL